MRTPIIIFSKLLLLTIVLSSFSCNFRQKMLEKTAAEENSKCPISQGATIRIDKVEALPNYTIKYTCVYPLLDLTGVEVDKKLMSTIGKKMVIRALQSSSDFNKIKKMSANFVYSYYDSQQNHLYDIEISSDEYKATLPPETDEEIAQGLVQSVIFEVKSLEKQLPIEVDAGTTLMQCTFFENEKTILYVFQLSGTTEKNALSNKNSYCAQMQNAIKPTANYLKYGFTYSYKYIDSKNNILCEFSINKDSE